MVVCLLFKIDESIILSSIIIILNIMKPSQYNIVIEKSPYSYWYNTLTQSFFRISLELGEKLKTMINSEANFSYIPDFLIEKLKSGGFVIDKRTDEIDLVRKFNRAAIDDKNYFLIILPTLNCNYHCWYCIQDHIDSKMSEKTVEKIKRHIDHMIYSEKIHSLHIDWFGGEPFLYFQDIVRPISLYAMEACKNAGISFYNSATTNGYFLDPSTVIGCNELCFGHFQITLDGTREFHNKVKFQNGCDSTFDLALEHINNILATIEKCHIILRINYTHRNMSSSIVDEVNRHIDYDHRKRIRIIPRKVWQEDTDRSFHTFLVQILDKFKEAGYNTEYWDPITNFIPCYANKKYYSAINYNGNVLKCTASNDLYDRSPKGELLDDGTIAWYGDYEKKYCEPTFENDRCLGCVKLPVCMGVCPKSHVNGVKDCKENLVDTSYLDSITSYIEREYEERP